MIQLQLDDLDVFGEIAADVARAHLQPCNAAPLAMRLDYHAYLLFNAGLSKSKDAVKEGCLLSTGSRRTASPFKTRRMHEPFRESCEPLLP